MSGSDREVSVTFRISTEMDVRLKALQAARDWSRSQVLREAVRQYLEGIQPTARAAEDAAGYGVEGRKRKH